MATRLQRSLVLAVVTAACVQAQTPMAPAVALERDFRGWGWDALVQTNGLITVATVPQIGARIMAFGLGDHESIFTNDAELGRVYEPEERAPWRNYGGYKTWPAPQAAWNWPPPPILDAGVYAAQILADTDDSVSIHVSSPLERWRTPGLRFERRLTVYRGSSRVRVDQTLVNDGEAPAAWSVWDVTQHAVNHPGKRDFDRFWVYLPLNPVSRYGPGGVRVSAESEAWRGEVAPGVFGVQFLPEAKKVFADADRGWICYADEGEGYIYAKTFDLFEGAQYPDEGARVEVWINNDPFYLEVEVVSPIVEIPAGGGRYTFTEEWSATRVNGPILAVSRLGATSRRLSLEPATGALRGTFGVFHVGAAQVVFLGADGRVAGRGPMLSVTPLAALALDEVLQVPPETVRVELRLLDGAGQLLGVLDAVEIPGMTGVLADPPVVPQSLVLEQSYPNPFNAAATIRYSIPGEVAGGAQLAVYDIAGERVRRLGVDVGAHAVVWDGADEQGRRVASGLYLYHLWTPLGQLTRRMVLLR